jgi:predicted nucleic acid-binding protein
MFLLDTNVISELRKSSTADRQVAAWAESVRRESMYISSVTVLEIERGILRVGRRDPRQAAILHDWLRTKLIERFSGRILSVDMDVALRCASLHVPDPKPELDAIIAATALVHGLILVTRNVSDFERTSVALLNPWD